MLTITLITAAVSAYRQGNLQIPAGIHKMEFMNSFAYNSVNVLNQINVEVKKCEFV